MMGRWSRASVALAAVVALAGCDTAGGGDSPSPTPTPSAATFTLIGLLDLNQLDLGAADGDSCVGEGGFTDIRPGAQVKVSDASGTIIALGELGNGFARDNFPTVRGTDVCQFAIVVDDIPDGGDGIYGVEVSDRGVINFEKSGDLASVALRLG